MRELHEWTMEGGAGSIHAVRWQDPDVAARFAVVLVHGYGEHIGRYDHVAEALVRAGAVVYGLDHRGHGRSDGERVLVDDFDELVADVHRLDDIARDERPELPMVMIGHSMGGLIAARYAQRYGSSLAALVLSGPAIGRFELVPTLLALDEIPDDPLDVSVLSRDPLVGATYADDPLVWHGAFKRPTLEAFATSIAAIDEAGSLGDLPLLWIHGADDQLVPIEGTRVGIAALRGANHRAIEYEGARHEVLNETNRDDVLAELVRFIDDTLAGAVATD